MELFREILKFNKEYNLIENNDTIVVGFSGGPDSVFLVEMLKKLQDFFKYACAAASIAVGTLNGEQLI